jgi:hypothetical protein
MRHRTVSATPIELHGHRSAGRQRQSADQWQRAAASTQDHGQLHAALQPTGGRRRQWYIYTDWVYRSSVNFFLYESVEFTGKSLTEGGLRAGYLWGNGAYEAAAYVRNITNQIRVVGGIDFNNLTGFINEPRTYGLQFKAVLTVEGDARRAVACGAIDPEATQRA